MMGKVVIIIQARMGSTRLPGKSLMDLCGKPLVGHILERVERAKTIDQIVLATSTTAENDALADYVTRLGIDVFRGAENDLLERYYKAAIHYNADTVLRLPADNPFPEPSEYDRLVEYHQSSDNDFSSNITNFMGNGYPDGIGVEAITMAALKKACENNTQPDQREHVALNFYDYVNDRVPEGSDFTVGTVKCPENISRPDIVLDINTQEDYQFLRSIYTDIYPENPDFTIHDVIEWFDKREDVS